MNSAEFSETLCRLLDVKKFHLVGKSGTARPSGPVLNRRTITHTFAEAVTQNTADGIVQSLEKSLRGQYALPSDCQVSVNIIPSTHKRMTVRLDVHVHLTPGASFDFHEALDYAFPGWHNYAILERESSSMEALFWKSCGVVVGRMERSAAVARVHDLVSQVLCMRMGDVVDAQRFIHCCVYSTLDD